MQSRIATSPMSSVVMIERAIFPLASDDSEQKNNVLPTLDCLSILASMPVASLVGQ